MSSGGKRTPHNPTSTMNIYIVIGGYNQGGENANTIRTFTDRDAAIAHARKVEEESRCLDYAMVLQQRLDGNGQSYTVNHRLAA
jgi:hypothetical protein